MSDENKAHERTAFSSLKKKAASPLTNGININKSGIILTSFESRNSGFRLQSHLLLGLIYFLKKNCNTKNNTMLTTINNT